MAKKPWRSARRTSPCGPRARPSPPAPIAFLTFSGRPSVAIPPDALVLSDPVKLSFPAAADLAISIFLPGAAMGAGIHYGSEQTIYVGPGDLTAAESLANPRACNPGCS